MVKRISSRHNEIVARFRRAARGADPDVMLLDGEHLVADAAASRIQLRHVLVSAEAAATPAHAALVERLDGDGVDVAIVTAPVISAASPVRSPSAFVALAERPPAGDVFRGSAPLVLIACDVQDPGNMGAIVRVAEAAGASGVLTAGRSADPFGWKALRGSMGSALRLPLTVCPTIDAAVEAARSRGCRIVATAPRSGRSLFEADLRGSVAILIGGEGSGLPPTAIERADERVTVPMHPPVESLNAAVTAALLAYEARRQRR
jgi:TrmH family RNA methyltransferase